MKLLLLLFCTAISVKPERPWSEFQAEQYTFLRIPTKFYYLPWQCCQMCGAGSEWENADFEGGRCIIRGKQHPGNWNSTDDLYQQHIQKRSECCYYCGYHPGDYEFVPQTPGEDFYGHCAAPKALHALPNFDGSAAMYPHDLGKVDDCHFCTSFVSHAFRMIDLNPDHMEDALNDHCRTYKQVKRCAHFVTEHLSNLMLYYRMNISQNVVCGRYLKMCPEDQLDDTLLSQLGQEIRRTTILNEYSDPSPRTLMKVKELLPHDFSFIWKSHNDSSLSTLEALKFLASFSILPNFVRCKICENVNMTFTNAKEFLNVSTDHFIWRCANCRDGGNGRGSVHKSVREGFLKEFEDTIPAVLRGIVHISTHPLDSTKTIMDTTGLSKIGAERTKQVVGFAQQQWLLLRDQPDLIGGNAVFIEFYEATVYMDGYVKHSMFSNSNMTSYIIFDSQTGASKSIEILNPDLDQLSRFLGTNIIEGSYIISNNWGRYPGLQDYLDSYQAEHGHESLKLISDTHPYVPSSVREWRDMVREFEKLYEECAVDFVFPLLFRKIIGATKVIGNTFFNLALFYMTD